MKRQTIKANYLNTICWWDNKIVDWNSAGKLYATDNTQTQLGKYHYAFRFDSAITSENGEYAFIYKKLGTKGLLLKNGELVREINRSYYCANVYEFPAKFLTCENVTYLVHCPIAYNQLDFENVETGEIITNMPGRKPSDIFHSRLEISPNNKFLMSKGWVWHPIDEIVVFDVKECINNPLLLDNAQFYPNVGGEICTASFIDDHRVLIGSSEEVFDELPKLPPKHISIWDLKTNLLSKSTLVKENFGNLFAISDTLTWDLFNCPKIINIDTGDIVDQNTEIDSGKQCSAIINETDYFPAIIFNKQTKQIAIKGHEKIEILTPDF